jgi:predicted nucleotidyltransferase component of viral defense system
MLSKEEITSISKTTGFKPHQQEKDYLLTMTLSLIYKSTETQLIFKGGTALAKAYGLNRFSEDLDFTLNDKTNFEALIRKISTGLRNYGVENSIAKEKSTFEFSETWKIKAKGPLFTTEKSSCFIRIEVSYREKTLLAPSMVEIFPFYKDIPNFQIIVMSIEEMLAEKVRAVMTRDKARDVYDLWFILNKNARKNEKLINKKLEYYNLRYSQKELLQKINAKKSEWEVELSPLLSRVPEFKTTVEFIKENLNL